MVSNDRYVSGGYVLVGMCWWVCICVNEFVGCVLVGYVFGVCVFGGYVLVGMFLVGMFWWVCFGGYVWCVYLW